MNSKTQNDAGPKTSLGSKYITRLCTTKKAQRIFFDHVISGSRVIVAGSPVLRLEHDMPWFHEASKESTTIFLSLSQHSQHTAPSFIAKFCNKLTLPVVQAVWHLEK